MSGTFTCTITGCQQPAARLPDGGDGFCDEHMAMAPETHRQRFLSVVRRLRALRDIWNDEGRYESVVASGRYLKLAHATCCAEEALDSAAQRLTLAILAAGHSSTTTAAPGAELRRSA
jgi:hypothetical protein